MAWCPHCAQDRPIRRQVILNDFCPHCSCTPSGHSAWCRGPVGGALDVCSFCNTHLFSKALDSSTYERLSAEEAQGRQELEQLRTKLRREALEKSGGCMLVILTLSAVPIVMYLAFIYL